MNDRVFDVILGMIIILMIIFAFKPIQRKVIKDAYKKADERSVSGKRIYDFSESGIDITSDVGKGHTNWDGFNAFGEESHYLWIHRMDNHIVLVDKQKLTTAQSAELTKYLSKIK